MSSYISYMGTDDIITDYASITALDTEELVVTGDIEVGGLVDGVDISALDAQVKDLEAKAGNYVDLNSYQVIMGNKVFESKLTYFSNPAPNSIVVDGGIKTRVLETTADGTSTFTGPTAFYRDIDAKHNILMSEGATVDGVDVSALNVEVKDHEERIHEIEDTIITLPTDYVNTKTAQFISGHKTFNNGLTSREAVTCHGDLIAVNPLVSGKKGTARMGVGLMGIGPISGPDDAAVILAGPEASVMFHNHAFYDEKNMNYDITCKSDKKLYINRGPAFPSAGPLMSFNGATSEIESMVNHKATNILASGYINCAVLTSSGNVRGVNFLSTGFSQVRDANSTGQVISGISIRGGGRSQQFFLSNGDGISETYYGSDPDGTGTVDKNQKWCISSRQAADGRLIFYRAPFYTGGSYDPVMDFKNTLSGSVYDCAINMHKILNPLAGIKFGANQTKLDYYEERTVAMDFNLGWNPPRVVFGKFRRVGKVVTVTVQALEQKVLTDPTYSVGGTFVVPPEFSPAVDVDVAAITKIDGHYEPCMCRIYASRHFEFLCIPKRTVTQTWGWNDVCVTYNVS